MLLGLMSCKQLDYLVPMQQCCSSAQHPVPQLLLQPPALKVPWISGERGRLLLGKWTGQPKMATPEFYESSLSKIHPSSHWLGCNSPVVLGKRPFHSTEHDCTVQRVHPPKAGWSPAHQIPQYKALLPWRFLQNPYYVGDSLFPDKGSRYHKQTNKQKLSESSNSRCC